MKLGSLKSSLLAGFTAISFFSISTYLNPIVKADTLTGEITSFLGTCLDAAAETIDAERGTLQLYSCNGSANQKWHFHGGKLIMNTPKGPKCLDAAAETIDAERGTLQLYRCNGSANQQWRFSRGKLIMNTPKGPKCLDAADETVDAERGTLQLYHCNGSDNQQWKFR
jgi:hypothetical protein